MATVGWIGLGGIGLPMACRLAGSVHDLIACSYRDVAARDAVAAAGARVVGSPREAAEPAIRVGREVKACRRRVHPLQAVRNRK